MPRKKTSRAAATASGAQEKAAHRPGRNKAPRNHRELAQAIFETCDPVAVGRELLASGSGPGSSVKARVWETLVEFLLGKPAPAPGSGSNAAVRIVWDLPAPPHETRES